MSHVATINVTIKDLTALADACERLGLDFRYGQKTHRWYGEWVKDYNGENAAYRNGVKPEDYGKCDHAIRIPGNAEAYEVGVVGQADGSFRLVWDFYRGGYGLMDKIGDNGQKLVQMYAVEAAKMAARRKGHAVTEQTLPGGAIKLSITMGA